MPGSNPVASVYGQPGEPWPDEIRRLFTGRGGRTACLAAVGRPPSHVPLLTVNIMTTADRPGQVPGRDDVGTEITTTVRRIGSDAVRVEVCGDVDLATAAVLAATLRQATDLRPTRLEVDLSGVTFLGCAGVDALRAARCAVPVMGLRGPGDAVRRLLALAGLDPLVDA
jgi:anti-sigma B factor antagonist